MNCGVRLKPLKEESKKGIDSYILIGAAFLAAIIIILLIYNNNQSIITAKVNSAVSKTTNKSAVQKSRNQPSMKMMQKIQQLKVAYQKNPKDYQINEQLGNSYFDIGQYDKAIIHYRNSVRVKDNQPDLLIDLGVAYFNSHMPDSALFFVKKAIAVKPDHSQGLYNLGIIYYNLNKPRQAIRAWQKLVDRHPESKEAQIAKGYITQIKKELNKS